MSKFVALLLSLLMTLSAAAPGQQQASAPQAETSWASIFSTVRKWAEDRDKTASVLEAGSLFASPSKSSRAVAQLGKDDTLTLLRIDPIAGINWAYVHSDALNVSGWLPASRLKLPQKWVASLPAPAATEPATEPTQETIPAYAKMGVVITSDLNIRTAPGVNNDRVGFYHYGDRVAILESRVGWGRTASGWICLDYVYMDGDMGTLAMAGNVTADRLNVRSGPGLTFDVIGSRERDDRLLIMEQVKIGQSYWGYTRFGWVCMDYIAPDVIPGTETPIYGYAYVTARNASVRSAPDAESPVVGGLAEGDLIPIWRVKTVDDVKWGRMSQGWFLMEAVNVTATFDQGEDPVFPPEPGETDPEKPTDPTEPEDPTDPSDPEKPTEPSEPEETTAPTEPEETAAPTEPEESTEPSVPEETAAPEPEEPTVSEPEATEPAPETAEE